MTIFCCFLSDPKFCLSNFGKKTIKETDLNKCFLLEKAINSTLGLLTNLRGGTMGDHIKEENKIFKFLPLQPYF